MKILFRKKDKKAIILFRQLQYICSQLLSIDTEISFLNEKSSDQEVENLEKASNEFRRQRENILGEITNLA